MYIKQIEIHNYGPIENLNISPSFDEIGNPLPLIILGKNGSGKTLLLSNIVDSLVEIKKLKYTDLKEIKGEQYFKIGQKDYILCSKDYSFVNIEFANETENAFYTDFMTNNLNEEFINQICTELGYIDTDNEQLFEIGFYRTISSNFNKFQDEFLSNILIFFPSSRYDHPAWLNQDKKIGFNLETSFVGQSETDIIKTFVLPEIQQWILEIVLDVSIYETKSVKREMINPENNQKEIVNTLVEIKGRNRKTLNLINNLLTIIYKTKIDNLEYARLGISAQSIRAIGVYIKRKDEKEEKINPSFSQFSSGEVLLLSLFTMLLKEYYNVNKKIANDLKQISGIVLIDEIDLHLHIDFQKNILPELIALFPKVQFIITTHSPFFITGLHDKTNGKYTCVNLPSGNIINFTDFTEYQTAYNTFIKNFDEFKLNFELLNKKLKNITKPLIITEGKTDWKHLKKALEKIQQQGKFLDLDIQFYENENDNQQGSSELLSICEKLAKLKNDKKTICIFDRDEPNIVKKICENGKYKKYSDYVFGICIPVPSHRIGHENISIEHYYLDSEIQQPNENSRRLFLSNEFSEKGRHKNLDIHFGNNNKLKNIVTEITSKIIDCDVFDSNDKNIALPKSDFAEYVLCNKRGFENFGIDEFSIIFEIIQEIINEKNDNLW